MERFPGGEHLTTSRTKMPQAIDSKFCTHISNRVLKKSSVGTGRGGGAAKKTWNKQSKFFKLLILVHLRNYFIEVLKKFLMCFEIMSQKILS